MLVDATGQPLSGQVFAYDAFGVRLDSAAALTSLLYNTEQSDPPDWTTSVAATIGRKPGPSHRSILSRQSLRSAKSAQESFCRDDGINRRDPSGHEGDLISTMIATTIAVSLSTFVAAPLLHFFAGFTWGQSFALGFELSVGATLVAFGQPVAGLMILTDVEAAVLYYRFRMDKKYLASKLRDLWPDPSDDYEADRIAAAITNTFNNNSYFDWHAIFGGLEASSAKVISATNGHMRSRKPLTSKPARTPRQVSQTSRRLSNGLRAVDPQCTTG